MSIFGKFMNKCQIQIDLNRVKLDPLAPDQLITQINRKNSDIQDEEMKNNDAILS